MKCDINPKMPGRNATTLVEVLVAIFVMALGLLTLLTLFPLGALSMAQAIKDDRSALAAANACALGESLSYRQSDVYLANQKMSMKDVFWKPWPNLMGADSIDGGPSYPVYLDPLGAQPVNNPVGVTTKYAGIPRVSPFVVPNQPAAYRWFSLLDEITFQKDGNNTGLPVGYPSSIERENRYTWAYMLRRQRYTDPAVVETSVVVYNGRLTQGSLGESVYGPPPYGPVVFSTSLNTVTIPYSGGTKPDIRKGNWILDATIVQNFNVDNSPPDPHGYFYRVVGVTDTGTSLQLELQSNPKKATQHGVLVFMENVVEVFDRGAGWQP
jgi:hypothetical protein